MSTPARRVSEAFPIPERARRALVESPEPEPLLPDDDPALATSAVARRDDPGTSWAAARSLSETTLRRSQQEVLRLLALNGDLTLEELEAVASASGVYQSPSGLRTRLHEIVQAGLARDSGRKRTTRAGRQAIVWEATP